MASLLEKIRKAIYPSILMITGVTIAIAGITSIVVITEFAPDLPRWIYHLASVFIFLTVIWWCLHFFLKGMALIEQRRHKTKEVN